MKYTANLRIPYPEPADPPRGADQMQALAERVDSAAVGLAMRADTPDGPQNAPATRWTKLKMGTVWSPQTPAWKVAADGGLTVPADGVWQISAQVNFGSEVRHTFNVGTDSGGAPSAGSAVNFGSYISGSIVATPVTLAKGDVIYAWLFPGIEVAVEWVWVSAVLLGPITPPTPPARDIPPQL